jgi:hypothetical protein
MLAHVCRLDRVKSETSGLDLVWDDTNGVGQVLVSTQGGRSVVLGYTPAGVSLDGVEPFEEGLDLKGVVEGYGVEGLADVVKVLEAEY